MEYFIAGADDEDVDLGGQLQWRSQPDAGVLLQGAQHRGGRPIHQCGPRGPAALAVGGIGPGEQRVIVRFVGVVS